MPRAVRPHPGTDTLVFAVDIVGDLPLTRPPRRARVEREARDRLPRRGAARPSWQVTDIVVGDGAEAAPGGQVLVHYVGVEFETGEEFDSSWDRGEPIEFPLRGLIQGWQDGIPGMKVGGRRQLVMPAAPGLRPRRRRAPARPARR